jgi:hypothetical protein
MLVFQTFRNLLKRNGYTDEVIDELWKWYGPPDRKAVAC